MATRLASAARALMRGTRVRRRASSSISARLESAVPDGTVLHRVTEAITDRVEAASEPVLRVSATSSRVRDLFILYPLRANAATAALLGAAGDSAAQLCEWKLGIMSPDKQTYNWERTLRMFAFGLVNGPLLHVWYHTLHSVTAVYRVSYEPLVSGRAGSMLLSWAAERSSLLQSFANLRVREVITDH